MIHIKVTCGAPVEDPIKVPNRHSDVTVNTEQTSRPTTSGPTTTTCGPDHTWCRYCCELGSKSQPAGGGEGGGAGGGV